MSTIQFPGTVQEAVAIGRGATYRAGGTDLQERRVKGISNGDLVELRGLPGLSEIAWRSSPMPRPVVVGPDRGPGAGGPIGAEPRDPLNLGTSIPLEAPGAGDPSAESPSTMPPWLRIGALTRMAAVADDRHVVAHYPGFAAAAGGLATPQIRAVGTLGGNLLQSVRCWYFRNPSFNCLKRGGGTCYAREGDHLYHSCWQTSPCVAPHPSTLGMALLAHDALVQVNDREWRTVDGLYGDGIDPATEHTLADGELLTAVALPPPRFGERAAYFRAISRARAEWPLVEACVRLKLDAEGRVAWIRGAMGGVATIPLRLLALEEKLTGLQPTESALRDAAEACTTGADPLPMTTYKVPLIASTVLETLERALAAAPAPMPPGAP